MPIYDFSPREPMTVKEKKEWNDWWSQMAQKYPLLRKKKKSVAQN